ncbi:unnamed protein product [Beet yellows virus]|uniref:RNA silencing suppressor n=3 Tax=Beet yellows virus TaxID=12161 RepID=P21_BYVU|nr:RNA silencing suppressor [Beet yellows virus]Q08545.1 RecName: Full=RNA silencing suppressor; AltName: Full=21 kDa protein; AltName: Full=p21 [Beet yellows virus isolate Ukraine]CAA37556.1 unnamed protein product [Beet yellows virus]CAA51870.1 unnamed protein product [Beet yellows virus]
MKFFLKDGETSRALSRSESLLRRVKELGTNSQQSEISECVDEFNELASFNHLLVTVEHREWMEQHPNQSSKLRVPSRIGEMLKEIRAFLKVRVVTPMHKETASDTLNAFLEEYCRITGLAREDALREKMRKVKSVVLFHHSELLKFEVTENMFSYTELLKLNLSLRVISSQILGMAI